MKETASQSQGRQRLYHDQDSTCPISFQRLNLFSVALVKAWTTSSNSPLVSIGIIRECFILFLLLLVPGETWFEACGSNGPTSSAHAQQRSNPESQPRLRAALGGSLFLSKHRCCDMFRIDICCRKSNLRSTYRISETPVRSPTRSIVADLPQRAGQVERCLFPIRSAAPDSIASPNSTKPSPFSSQGDDDWLTKVPRF